MQNNLPKVTVVTVTYNAEKYLEQTIKSVIGQDYPNIEYIIIDGASTDGTIDIIKQYEEHIDYWISEPDRGIYDAMNKGIDVATAEWINFMNAGDSFCEKETLSKVFSSETIKYDLIFGDHLYITDSNLFYKKAIGLDRIFNSTPCCHQSLFCKTDIAKETKFDISYKFISDHDFILKAYKNNNKFRYLEFPIANYRAGGFYEDNRFLATIEQMYMISKYLDNPLDILESSIFYSLESKKPQKKKNLHFTKLFNSFQASIEKLELSNKKFILYGFGNIGKVIYNQYKDSIIKIVDKNFETLSKQENIEICELDTLRKYKNNFILISVLGREEEIRKELAEKYFIEKNQILLININ
jgi:glycosyltransferase involved in cell wall biosynthesis